MNYEEALTVLLRHGVEFIVVGGTAAAINGAPVVTQDLDVVHRRQDDNIARLCRALRDLQATYRHDARGLTPQPSHLRSRGHQLLATRVGPLDVLGAIDNDDGYEELLHCSKVIGLAPGNVRVLTLERLIEGKRRVGRPKDLAMLDVLLAVLDERRKAEAAAD